MTLPLIEVDYSRDGSWVAFVRQTDHTVWRAKPDGSNRVQLTSTELVAHQPHWSPDGQRIAFMGRRSNGAWRIFLIAFQGGRAEELLPKGEDQGVPTWSRDGHYIVFGERLGKPPASEMSIRIVDTLTRESRVLNGTTGLWSPRWALNGKHIVAVTSDSKAIRLLSVDGSKWIELVRMDNVDNVTWSYDSQYLYFDGRKNPNSALDLFRISIGTGNVEQLVDMKGFPVPAENWYGVSRDGTLLAARGYQNSEIYALNFKLP